MHKYIHGKVICCLHPPISSIWYFFPRYLSLPSPSPAVPPLAPPIDRSVWCSSPCVHVFYLFNTRLWVITCGVWVRVFHRDMDESGNHHSQQTDTRTENQTPALRNPHYQQHRGDRLHWEYHVVIESDKSMSSQIKYGPCRKEVERAVLSPPKGAIQRTRCSKR